MIAPAAPLATADLPGTGGRTRVEPEDFVVEELPLYEPSGAGDHVYVTIEKRNRTTLDAARALAAALGRPLAAVGYAGLKDARAVTLQTLSVEGADPEQAAALELPGIRVRGVARHRNKLKKGHLRGNRFRLRVRDVVEDAPARARAVLDRLVLRGVPNWFGPQRFGLAGNTAELGRALLLHDGRAFFRALLAGVPEPARAAAREHAAAGDAAGALGALPSGHGQERRALAVLARARGDHERALRGIERPLRSLALSALQSELFNAVLVRRWPDYDRLEAGDLAWLHRNGAVFAVADPGLEEPRWRAFEISPSGPLFGRRCTAPQGRPGQIETAVLGEAGLDDAAFQRAAEPRGARRPLRVPLAGVAVEAPEPGLLDVRFELPPGAYATVVLREVTKAEDAS